MVVLSNLITIKIDKIYMYASHKQLEVTSVRRCSDNNLSCVMYNLAFCICENKDAVTAQLISAFVFTTYKSTIPLLPKSEI